MVTTKLKDIILEKFPGRIDYYEGPSKFNDHPKTTLEEVLQVLKEAGL